MDLELFFFYDPNFKEVEGGTEFIASRILKICKWTHPQKLATYVFFVFFLVRVVSLFEKIITKDFQQATSTDI